jgi:hypothetical protein
MHIYTYHMGLHKVLQFKHYFILVLQLIPSFQKEINIIGGFFFLVSFEIYLFMKMLLITFAQLIGSFVGTIYYCAGY